MNPDYVSTPTDPNSSFTISNAGPVDQSSQVELPDNQATGQDDEQLKMFDYSMARIHLQRIIED